MCGFVGEISPAGGVDGGRLARMAAALAHRGPDEGGVLVAPGGRWGVAHRRLNILDPAGGRQPFAAAGRRLTLVYNGEIYGEAELRRDLAGWGWEFRSRSDTEVVLALYARHGLDFVRHLRGEFALALLDEAERRLVLVRDRFGLKPLFYIAGAGRILFASEVKALFQDERVERAFEPQHLGASMVAAETPGYTPFRGVLQVPNAHLAVIDLDSLAIDVRRYWDAFADRRRDAPAAFADQVAAVRAEVDEAIRLRLRADVPVGVTLSGGLDSSVVAMRVAAALDRVDAFAISYRSSPRHDEFHHAQAVSRGLPNVTLHEIPVTPGATLAALPRTVWHMERPFANLHSVAKVIAARAIGEHVPCVLTGEGGDETFCGYPSFWLQDVFQRAGYRRGTVRRALRERAAEESRVGENRYYFSWGLRMKSGKAKRDVERILGWRPADLATSCDTYRVVRRLMRPEIIAGIRVSPPVGLAYWLRGRLPPASAHAELLQYIHLTAHGPEYIATLSDRTEYAGSVEARHPLFDHRVVELAMGLPLASKLHGSIEKHVLREAYRELLPPSILARRKQAFLLPPASFAHAEGQALIERYLSPEAVRDAGIFAPRRVAALLLARRLRPHSPTINLLVTVLVTTHALHRHLIVEPRAAPPT